MEYRQSKNHFIPFNFVSHNTFKFSSKARIVSPNFYYKIPRRFPSTEFAMSILWCTQLASLPLRDVNSGGDALFLLASATVADLYHHIFSSSTWLSTSGLWKRQMTSLLPSELNVINSNGTGRIGCSPFAPTSRDLTSHVESTHEDRFSSVNISKNKKSTALSPSKSPMRNITHSSHVVIIVFQKM